MGRRYDLHIQQHERRAIGGMHGGVDADGRCEIGSTVGGEGSAGLAASSFMSRR